MIRAFLLIAALASQAALFAGNLLQAASSSDADVNWMPFPDQTPDDNGGS